MIRPEDGSVIFNGQDVTRVPMYQRAQRGMGYLSQEPSIVRRLSVEDNLVKGAAGQAVQNMNIMFGLDEGLGLSPVPLVP